MCFFNGVNWEATHRKQPTCPGVKSTPRHFVWSLLKHGSFNTRSHSCFVYAKIQSHPVLPLCTKHGEKNKYVKFVNHCVNGASLCAAGGSQTRADRSAVVPDPLCVCVCVLYSVFCGNWREALSFCGTWTPVSPSSSSKGGFLALPPISTDSLLNTAAAYPPSVSLDQHVRP